MLESDPVGATWGSGVRRAPQVTTWGWNQAAVAKVQAPTLMVAGAHDKQVRPERVKELYADLGARQKVFVDLGCSSHNAAVGAEPPTSLQGVARMAHAEFGQRQFGRRNQVWILITA